MILDLFVWFLAGFTILNLGYYLYFSKFSFITKSTCDRTSTTLSDIAPHASETIDAVSVIICAKNEEENLKRLLPLLLEQNHPNFEVVVVNDYSKDNTLEVIESFMEKDSRVKLVDIVPNESFWGNKKYALTLGIKKARNNKLLFTDADCTPASKSWISEMTQQLVDKKTIVLGYSGYEKIKGSFLNALIRFETAIAATQYLSYAVRGNAYMGVGRNLAYTADQFYASSGFMSHMKVLGGDDDLFVNEAANRENVAVSLNPDSFTYSVPKKSWNAWWKQKRRHINTAGHYKWKHKIALGLFFVSQIGFFASAVVAGIFSPFWMIVLGIIVLRYLVTWLVIGYAFKKLQESALVWFYPFYEVILLFSQGALYFNNLVAPPRYWE
ncbi:glycosyl transferase family 2 [Nonlabens spongiae]|uniref:Glycosyl transferase family 2 n=1 Tax=Nonlabens spongiae TaxID=331648 RepID=A0A1W6MKD9_9FLAO|nr:glycosyltransferase [Nonlabens spongiae]ARN78032.1 glycosyl transferase family 2 [Nonlabens spongiae]